MLVRGPKEEVTGYLLPVFKVLKGMPGLLTFIFKRDFAKGMMQ